MANEDFDAFRSEYMSQPAQPRALTKSEFLGLPENAQLKKTIKSSAVILYVCAAITGLAGFLVLDSGALILLDVAIMAGLGLGIHLKQSKGCAIALLIYSVVSCVLTIISTGKVSGWLIIIAGIYAVSATFKLDKQWKQYRQQGL